MYKKAVVNPGSVMIGWKTAQIFCAIEIDSKYNLSIRGVIGPKSNGDCIGSAGQIDGEFAHQDPEENDSRTHHPITPDEITFNDGWDEVMWFKFLHIWKRWHLNDMKAGCEHQRALGWDKERIDPDKPAMSYGKHYPGQQVDSWNLKGWAYPPHGYLCKPCPECGYKYGTSWLTEKVPDEVLQWLWNDLPLSQRSCPWATL